ncbi:MAG: UPF0149 family protein, partial [Betaproteobacteria bacterium]
GRMFWGTMPKPQRGWRIQPLPRPERNAPCPCGSGKKFKQCCQPFEFPAEMAPPALNMFKFVLDLWPETKLHEIPLRRLDPDSLADTAKQWLEEGDGARAIVLLEGLFANPANLDEHHVSCFDQLCDAYLEVGMQVERETLSARIARHPNKDLASTALHRATVLACDEGDYESAWERFGQALRLTPDDPYLAHLEVLVLQSEGRLDEAMARAKVWAARLRRKNRPDYERLIESLEQMAENPGRALLGLAERDGPEDDAWSDLLETAPEVELLYSIEKNPLPDDTWGSGRIAIAMKPLQVLVRVEREWRKRFFVQKPGLVDLQGDASGACEDFAAVVEFMEANPAAWQSFEILDDLVLIARDWFDDDAEGVAGSDVLLELTDQAVELLEMCVAGTGEGKAVLAWSVPQNRAPLRLVAQRIDALLSALANGDGDADLEIDALNEWMLELNPNDNHGYRNPAMQGYLVDGDTQRAIELAQRYPADVGDLPFDLALALFQSGRREEAATAWARGADSTPAIAATLLARNPKPPDLDDLCDEQGDYDNPYEVLGGPEHAWRYRMLMLDAWTRSGALAWAKTLPRVPVPKPAKKSPIRQAGKKDRNPPGSPPPPDPYATLDETALLQALIEHGFAIVPLHGMLTAATLSPRMMMPGQWLTFALEFRVGAPQDGIEALNAAIQPLMGLYNSINSALRMKRGEGYVPSSVLTTAEPAQATEWARGFMRIVEQERAAWRDKTSTSQGKSALTVIERAAAGMVADDRLRQELAALGLPAGATWHDVLGAATRRLAAS